MAAIFSKKLKYFAYLGCFAKSSLVPLLSVSSGKFSSRCWNIFLQLTCDEGILCELVSKIQYDVLSSCICFE